MTWSHMPATAISGMESIMASIAAPGMDCFGDNRAVGVIHS